MKDRNEFFFSGVVEDFKRIQTRTGTPMIAFQVRCWRESIRCIAFKSIAEQTELTKGDYIECRGHVQGKEWIDREGNKRSGWQVVCHEITLAGDDVQAPPPARMRTDAPEQGNLFPGGRPDPCARFQYTDGPF